MGRSVTWDRRFADYARLDQGYGAVAYSVAKIPANFSRTLATSSGLARATGGKSLSRSNGRQASITARELVELALSSSGSSGVDQARRKNSMSSTGSQRVHTAHITSKISVGSTSSSTTTTNRPR